MPGLVDLGLPHVPYDADGASVLFPEPLPDVPAPMQPCESKRVEGGCEGTVPRRFIRVWLGPRRMPERHERWWCEFQQMHPGYEFLTIGDGFAQQLQVPPALRELIERADSCAAAANVLRLIALEQLGGVYVDTDVKPLRPFDPLLLHGTPFIGRRSSRSFENAVIGSPAHHPALKDLLSALPGSFWRTRSENGRGGPAFVSSLWFGRPDVRHLDAKAFYPYNGFGTNKATKDETFANDEELRRRCTYAAHFSEHRWGGRMCS